MDNNSISAPATEAIARIGLGARAFVYFAVAWLLADGAFSSRPDDGASPGDAFRTIEHQQGGRILLIALAIGLFLYALWRFQQAILDAENQGHDAKGVLARLGMMSSGISYLLVGIAAFAVTRGANDESGSSGGKTEETARWLMEQPYGRWLVALGGLVLAGIGCAQMWRAKSGQWKHNIDLTGWAGRLTGLIAFGIAGRGVLFILVGLFLLLGGVSADQSDVKGLAATLGWVRGQPFGFWLFLASAAAIGIYGIYSAVQSLRYKFPDS
ncbi:DUF1206 domain-containing protein [Henriciella sp.]|uniref:DUF1206 domain-containing protein n=1 Tax=Henriciella sp. TaxID=1968823 RepID=UPI002609EBF8|nr:DUF1206 domain-containing protein [Henriciella sp.]